MKPDKKFNKSEETAAPCCGAGAGVALTPCVIHAGCVWTRPLPIPAGAGGAGALARCPNDPHPTGACGNGAATGG